MGGPALPRGAARLLNSDDPRTAAVVAAAAARQPIPGAHEDEVFCERRHSDAGACGAGLERIDRPAARARQVLGHGRLSAVHGLTAVLAHFANPDGTPAQAPYIKK